MLPHKIGRFDLHSRPKKPINLTTYQPIHPKRGRKSKENRRAKMENITRNPKTDRLHHLSFLWGEKWMLPILCRGRQNVARKRRAKGFAVEKGEGNGRGSAIIGFLNLQREDQLCNMGLPCKEGWVRPEPQVKEERSDGKSLEVSGSARDLSPTS